jgi:hypothetical protein
MQPRDYHSAARRWAKYPAAILFILAVVWLINNYFELNVPELGQQTETGLGILMAVTYLLVIPLGSILIGVCVMFLQRWALWGAGIIALIPLIVKSIHIIARISGKFTNYRVTGSSSEYGGAIMWAFGLLAMWALYGIMIYHLHKALYWHAKARQWVKRPASAAAAAAADKQSPAADGDEPESDNEVCLLMPDTENEQDY